MSHGCSFSLLTRACVLHEELCPFAKSGCLLRQHFFQPLLYLLYKVAAKSEPRQLLFVALSVLVQGNKQAAMEGVKSKKERGKRNDLIRILVLEA